MIWLEHRTDDRTYNPGWNFSESVWVPTQARDGRKSPFRSLINQVVKGDIVFHLININKDKIFIGYSTALTDGYLTTGSPTQESHPSDFTKIYYKLELTDFQPLSPTVSLSDFFNNNNRELTNYFTRNKESQANKKHLFYAIQSGKLQCLKGAYFSEFDGILSSLLVNNYSVIRVNNQINDNAKTGVTVREIEQRVGHQEFSDTVKANFNSRCCFPSCEVEGRGFLISGHIARWADNESLRGRTSNGLCFCLMHDKAFEKGYFTLNEQYQVVLVNADFCNRQWLRDLLEKGQNLEIKPRQINPLIEALHDHWQRIGYTG
jgi:hypothetical protein